MWDHGEGIFSNGRGARGDSRTRGVCNDESNGGWLNIWDMSAGLKDVKDKYGITIDIVSFDVCWLGTMETAYELMPYADYFAASQEEEPNPGWNYYRPMSTLAANPDIAPGALASKIATDFKEEYKDENYTEDRYVTYATVDLNRFENSLIPLMNTFADELALNIYDNYFIIDNARSNSDLPRRSSKNYMRDFFHFTELIYQDPSTPENIHSAAKAVLDEYNQTVIEFIHGSLHPDAKGMYIYLPGGNYRSEYDSKLSFATERWDEFVRLFITPIQITHTQLNDSDDTSKEFEISAIIKGYKLDEDNVYVFYNDSETEIITPIQMKRVDGTNEFSAKIIVNNYNVQVYYYIRATENNGLYITSPANLDFSDASTWYSFYIGSDTKPPLIIHNPIVDIIAEASGEPYEFYVNISDNLGINPDSLYFCYNLNNSEEFTMVPLMQTDKSDRYYCYVPNQPANTNIFYFFNATDLSTRTNEQREPTSGTFRFNVSRTKPKAEIDLEDYQWNTYETITFTSTSQPEDAIQSYLWDFGDGSTIGTTKEVTHKYTDPGVYTVTLKVIDANGLSDTEVVTLVIINSPPIANINYDAIYVNSELREVDTTNNLLGIVYEDDIIEIDCSESIDEDGYVFKWIWNFGDGNEYTEIHNDINQDGIFDPLVDKVIPVTQMPVIDQEERLNSSANGKISYRYIFEGEYTIEFKVTDNDDSGSNIETLHISISNRLPIPEPGFNIQGMSVEFYAHSEGISHIDTPSDNGSLNYTWDFGDGVKDYSPNPTHTFSKRDKYEVTLVVIDDDGATVEETIVVNLKQSDNYFTLVIGIGSLAGVIIVLIIVFLIFRKKRLSKGPEPSLERYLTQQNQSFVPGPQTRPAQYSQPPVYPPPTQPRGPGQLNSRSDSQSTSTSLKKSDLRRSQQRSDENKKMNVGDLLSKIK
jgi:PKD repeat protein